MLRRVILETRAHTDITANIKLKIMIYEFDQKAFLAILSTGSI